jgi:hypothetical protein
LQRQEPVKVILRKDGQISLKDRRSKGMSKKVVLLGDVGTDHSGFPPTLVIPSHHIPNPSIHLIPEL